MHANITDILRRNESVMLRFLTLYVSVSFYACTFRDR